MVVWPSAGGATVWWHGPSGGLAQTVHTKVVFVPSKLPTPPSNWTPLLAQTIAGGVPVGEAEAVGITVAVTVGVPVAVWVEVAVGVVVGLLVGVAVAVGVAVGVVVLVAVCVGV